MNHVEIVGEDWLIIASVLNAIKQS